TQNLISANVEKFGVGTGNQTTGALWDFGTSGTAANRALGVISTSSTASSFGAILVNNTAQTLNQLSISYTGEQWRQGGTAGDNSPLSFFYEVGNTAITSFATSGVVTGTGTNVSGLNFTAPVASGTANALDGTAAANQRAISGQVNNLTWAPGQA